MSWNQEKGNGKQLKGSNLGQVKAKHFVELYRSSKKIYTKIWFLIRNFQPDPHRPSGILKIPSGLQGIWAKIPSEKPEFLI